MKIPNIVDLGNEQILELLERAGFGHLGCCRNNQPYVIPIHFAYNSPYLYFYTTEGMKTEIISENPTVCLQVEDVIDRRNWKSVIVTGTAELVTDHAQIKRAKKLITAINPELIPARSIRWMDQLARTNVRAFYRILPERITGRATVV